MNQNIPPITIETSFKRIVVINTAFLGDLVLTIPFMTLLKTKYPQSHISLVCKKGIGDLFTKLKLVDTVYEVQKGNAGDYASISGQLNHSLSDIVFCIHRSVRSYLFSLRIKSSLRIGYEAGYNFFGFKRKIKRDLRLPEPLRIIQLLTVVDEGFANFFLNETGAIDFNSKDSNGRMIDIPMWAKFPSVSLDSKQIMGNPLLKDTLSSFPSHSQRIAIFPGSVWNTKRWPVDSFARLIDYLSHKNFVITLMGGTGEEIYGQQIEKLIKPTTKITNLIGKTSVWESVLLLSQYDLVVANDSASAHIAAFLAKKVLVFFGPTVLNFGYRPWGDSVFILENSQLKCRPCGAHGPNECPIKTHECMTSISAESAFKKVESMFRRI